MWVKPAARLFRYNPDPRVKNKHSGWKVIKQRHFVSKYIFVMNYKLGGLFPVFIRGFIVVSFEENYFAQSLLGT